MEVNKFGGVPLYQNTVTGKRAHMGKSNPATISSLRVSRNMNSTTIDPESSTKVPGVTPNITPPPVKVPNLNNQSFGLYQGSGLGGGGLSRASGMSLGRHQI